MKYKKIQSERVSIAKKNDPKEIYITSFLSN